VELWEASPLGDLTLESLRPEAGLPQGVPRSSVTRRDLTPSVPVRGPRESPIYDLISTKAPQGIRSCATASPAWPSLVGGEPSRRPYGGKPSPRGWPPTGAPLETAAIPPAELWC